MINFIDFSMSSDDITISDLKHFMEERLVAIEERMATKDELNTLMEFLQEHMVAKEDLEVRLSNMQAGINKRFEDMEKHSEGQFNRVHAELALIQQDLDDIKKRLADLEKRTQEDGDVSAREVVALRKRVEVLEQQVAILHAAHA